MEDKISIKCVLFGNAAVGKTSFSYSFDGSSIINYLPPCVSPDITSFDIEGTNILLRLHDTAGQEKYCSLSSMYYRDVQIAIFITTCDEETQKADDESLNEFISSANEYACGSFRSVFLLNKIDLYKNNQDLLNDRMKSVKKLLDSRTDIEGDFKLIPISCLTLEGMKSARNEIETIAKEIVKNMETPIQPVYLTPETSRSCSC